MLQLHVNWSAVETLTRSLNIKALSDAGKILCCPYIYMHLHRHAWIDSINAIDLNKEVIHRIEVTLLITDSLFLFETIRTVNVSSTFKSWVLGIISHSSNSLSGCGQIGKHYCYTQVKWRGFVAVIGVFLSFFSFFFFFLEPKLMLIFRINDTVTACQNKSFWLANIYQ